MPLKIKVQFISINSDSTIHYLIKIEGYHLGTEVYNKHVSLDNADS